ncbi:MAG: HTH-type transcriptional repressor DasR [Chloroflexi bacterium ADurb.Bin360]|nr:MAG: HTH-type transcriptional repressor DasR [Chloroflexi bacterium ADurb.Bin360]
MSKAKRLDAAKEAALHQQLYLILRECIKSGVFVPGQRLPSERHLAAEYGVSRTTVQRALRWLSDEGSIYSRPGSGYYVALPTNDPRLHLVDFPEQMQADNLSYVTRVLEQRVISADFMISQNLNLPQGEQIILIQNLRLVYDTPICIETNYLPLALFPDFLDLEVESVHKALEEHYGVRLSQGTQTVHALLATPEECELLQASSPLAVLVIRRRTLDWHQKVILYSVSVFKGEHYRLRMTLRRN